MARAGGGWRWKILIGQRHAAYRRRGRAEKSQIDPILAHRAKTWPTPDDLNAELALPTSTNFAEPLLSLQIWAQYAKVQFISSE